MNVKAPNGAMNQDFSEFRHRNVSSATTVIIEVSQKYFDIADIIKQQL